MNRAVGPPRVVNIEDLRRLAKRRLPRAVFDYVDGGADAEWTLEENRRAFERVRFRPRNGVVTPDCDLRTSVLGRTLDVPFLLAPVGSTRLLYPRGECLAAREAGLTGNRLYPFHPGWFKHRRRQGGGDGARLVSTLPGRRSRCCSGCD